MDDLEKKLKELADMIEANSIKFTKLYISDIEAKRGEEPLDYYDAKGLYEAKEDLAERETKKQ